jgi:hypothetical protein
MVRLEPNSILCFSAATEGTCYITRLNANLKKSESKTARICNKEKWYMKKLINGIITRITITAHALFC